MTRWLAAVAVTLVGCGGSGPVGPAPYTPRDNPPAPDPAPACDPRRIAPPPGFTVKAHDIRWAGVPLDTPVYVIVGPSQAQGPWSLELQGTQTGTRVEAEIAVADDRAPNFYGRVVARTTPDGARAIACWTATDEYQRQHVIKATLKAGQTQAIVGTVRYPVVSQ